MSRAPAGGALRHPARPILTGDGAGKPRHAHERSREKGRGTAAEADGTDDPVLPAGAVRRHPWTDWHQGHRDAMTLAVDRVRSEDAFKIGRSRSEDHV